MRVPRSPLVVHVESGSAFDVYVGRGTAFGNPFRAGPAQNRSQSIEAFREWLLGQPELMERVRRELRGKVLACHCRPKSCHADVLAMVANG